MKKLFILPVLLCLCSCDNNTIVGKCLPNERTVTTTEQNGKTINEIEESVEYTERTTTNTITDNTTNKSCDKKCTKLCKKR